MTDPPAATVGAIRRDPGGARLLRWAVLALAGAECLLALLAIALLLGGQGGDPLGRAIAGGLATIIALPAGLGALPALLLALAGRWLPLALLLALAAPLALVALMGLA